MANLAPVVTGPIQVFVSEDDAPVMISATWNTYDPDLGDLVRATGIPTFLTEGIGYDPVWNMFIISPSPAFETLAAGQVTIIRVDYLVTDGTLSVPHSLEVVIEGVNDAAIIAGDLAGAVAEDGQTVAQGQLLIADVDNGESSFQPGVIAGAYGSLTLTAGGAWTYTLANDTAAVQDLASGQTVSDVLTIRSYDGTARQITVTITGADEPVINGTANADVLTGTALGEVLNGFGGADRLNGMDGADTLNGGAGADSLYGGNGDDVLIHDAADKVQSGGAGQDTLRLAGAATVNLAANDQVSGDKGTASGLDHADASAATAAVSLTGNAGANRLTGGAGGDRLTGAAGADSLTGNAGADLFIFRALSDSQGDARDVIADFTRGSDRIDVSAIDAISGGSNNAFSFIGAAGFTAAGQLRFDAATGLVEADVNGDRVADLAFAVSGGVSLWAGDFLL